MEKINYKFNTGDSVKLLIEGEYVIGEVESRYVSKTAGRNIYKVVFCDKTFTWCLEDKLKYFPGKLKFNKE